MLWRSFLNGIRSIKETKPISTWRKKGVQQVFSRLCNILTCSPTFLHVWSSKHMMQLLNWVCPLSLTWLLNICSWWSSGWKPSLKTPTLFLTVWKHHWYVHFTGLFLHTSTSLCDEKLICHYFIFVPLDYSWNNGLLQADVSYSCLYWNMILVVHRHLMPAMFTPME